MVAAGALIAPLAAVTLAMPAHALTRVDIDPSIISDPFGGWGTSLAWSANYTGDWDNREELADLLFGQDPDGENLGLTIARYNIGGGDNPENAGALRPGADVPGWRPDPDEDYDWNADPRQRWWLEAAKSRVPEELFIVDAIAYSAPYWMTQTQRSTGNVSGSQDNLLPGAEEDFADYLADVVEHFAENEGIEFRVLSPLNEPSTDYWVVTGRQEGMHVSPGANQAAIMNATHAALAARGLSTGMSAVDETGIDLSISNFIALRDAGFDMELVDQINVHTYSGGDRRGKFNLAVGSAEKRLQMSEITLGGGAYAPDTIWPSLALAERITQDMRELQPEEWVYWQALESEPESIDGNGNWGLVHYGDNESQEYSITRKFHTMRQYSQFIRPGAQFVWNSDSRTLTAVDPNTGDLTIVSYNNSSTAAPLQFDLGAFRNVGATAEAYITSATQERAGVSDVDVVGGQLTTSIPAQSIVTLVVPAELPLAAAVANGNFELGPEGQNPLGWRTFGGDAYGTHNRADYTQSGGTGGGQRELVHYLGAPFDVYSYQRIAVGNGAYRVSAQTQTNGLLDSSQLVISGYGGPELAVDVPNTGAWTEIAIDDIEVTTGFIELGFRTSDDGNSGWATFDEVTLTASDTEAPVVSIGASDPADSGWHTTDVEVSVSATDDASEIAGIEYSLDGGDWSAYTAPVSLSDGEWDFSARAWDSVGNVSAPTTETFRVDTIAPTVTSTLGDDRSLGFIAQDDGSGVATVEYSIDGGAWLEAVGPVTLNSDAVVVDYRATDVAGNQSETSQRDVPAGSTNPGVPGEPGTPSDPQPSVVIDRLSVAQGGQFSVTVSGLEPGAQVRATLFSEPLRIAGIAPANSDGVTTFTVSIPTAFSLGTHTLVVEGDGFDAVNTTITVTSATGLASTGVSQGLPTGILLAALLLTLGAAARFVRRRRTTLTAA